MRTVRRAIGVPAGGFALALLALCTAFPAAAGAVPPASSCSAPEHHQLDFWVGEWEARDSAAKPDDKPAHSSIQSILGGCVVLENWQGEDGHDGKSLNGWDPVRRLWVQTWMDDQGGIGEFAGVLRDGKLVLEGESHWPGRAAPVQRRITYEALADGRVRQSSEASTDGKVWKPLYDLYYHRTRNPPTTAVAD